jgi:hypothetical protein
MTANFSAERMAASGLDFRIRALPARRHRSPARSIINQTLKP